MNVAALLFLALVAAEPTTGIIFGTVSSDYDDHAIVGAVVTVWGSDLSDTTRTDTLGHYSLQVQSGLSYVTASSDSYMPTSSDTVQAPNEKLRLDFRLHPKPVEMPVVDTRAEKRSLTNVPHNDSILRLLRRYRFVQIEPWVTRVDGSRIPDSSAIRSNNQKMKAALLAFQRKRGSLFRKPASYFLADTTSPRHYFGHHYIIVASVLGASTRTT